MTDQLMKRGRRFRPEEIQDILSAFKVMTELQSRSVGETCELIGAKYHRSPDVIARLVQRFNPTIDSASRYIKANALKLAMRVVREANVQESIDILGRENLGVLAPKQSGGAGQGGFFLSVQADSCGAVKVAVGVQGGPAPQPVDGISPSSALRADSGYGTEMAMEPPLEVPYVVEAVEGEESSVRRHRESQLGVPHPNQGTFGRFAKPEEEWPRDHQEALRVAREKISKARSLAQKQNYREVEV